MYNIINDYLILIRNTIAWLDIMSLIFVQQEMYERTALGMKKHLLCVYRRCYHSMTLGSGLFQEYSDSDYNFNY